MNLSLDIHSEHVTKNLTDALVEFTKSDNLRKMREQEASYDSLSVKVQKSRHESTINNKQLQVQQYQEQQAEQHGYN